ncbi:hypothetical protein F383_38005 [Gossypium arboreum]|uniref:Uncharacterized protein n=1 Tax=Gossypium arboreum TaxID=29729 RepID=A0A0B0MDP5_GOSAR|nr:hypothetical protein F383_38005 [Gossypium arboreum]
MRGERKRSRLRSPSSRAPVVSLMRPRVVAYSSPYGGRRPKISIFNTISTVLARNPVVTTA